MFPPRSPTRSLDRSWLALSGAAALHIFLIVGQGTSAPQSWFNDSEHRLGRAADWFGLYGAGFLARAGLPVYADPPDVAPYGYPFRGLPSQAQTLGFLAAHLAPWVSYWLGVVLVEIAWCLAPLVFRRWFTRANHFRWATAVWLACAPLWLDLYMGAGNAIAALGLVLLLALERRRHGRVLALGGMVAGLLHPLTLLAAPVWLRRRARWAAISMLLVVAIAGGIEFARHPVPWSLLSERFFDDLVHAGNIGLRGLTGTVLKHFGTNPHEPRLIHYGGVAAGATFLLAALLVTVRSRRPRAGPLITLWVVTWFLAAPQAWEHQLVLLLPALVRWLAARPSPLVLASAAALVLPTPFYFIDDRSLGQGVFVDPHPGWPWLTAVVYHAWRLAPLLLLFAEAARQLRPRPLTATGERRAAWAAAAPLAALTLGLGIAWGPSSANFPVDDAYIHLSFARNLATGGGFAFNAGEPSTGITAPLWTLVLALLFLLPGSIITAALAVAFACYLGSTLLTAALARRLARNLSGAGPGDSAAHWFGLAAGATFAATGNVIWFTASGMETILFVFLGLLAIWSYFTYGLRVWTMMLLGLLAPARPEGILLASLVLVWEATSRRSSWRRLACAAAIVLAFTLPYFLWSRHVTGTWLPSSFFGKTLTYVATGFSLGALGGFLDALWGYWYVNDFFMRPAFWLALFGVCGGAAILAGYARREEALPALRREGVALAILLAAWGFLHAAAYGVKFRALISYSRYVAPLYALMPILAAGGLAVLWELGRSAPERRRRALGGVLRGLVAAFALVLPAFALAQYPYWQTVYRHNIRHLDHVHLAAGRWLRDHTAAEDKVATFDVGAIHYVSNRYTEDIGGLIDHRAHRPLWEHRCGPFLLEQGVQWIVHLDYPNPEAFTGIYRDVGRILRQTFVVDFVTPGYFEPVILHSTKMAIFRLEPIGMTTPQLAGGERFHSLSLAPVANAGYRGDPFRPGFDGKVDHFPDLAPGVHSWQGIPFTIGQDRPGARQKSVMTTCYGTEVAAALPLRAEPSSALWLALDGGKTMGCWAPCALVTVQYSDGTRHTQEIVPYNDVWDYWQQEEIPGERVLWQAPGTRQSLSTLGVPLDPSRLPIELMIERTGGGEAGIALFAATQVISGEGAGPLTGAAVPTAPVPMGGPIAGLEP